ncbi:PIR Superfamily Protein [Plasmodium ovale wallikeri]|uniref:PIR Superfamily Protein n=1 Tax=Plasmodium ovale wallikeri TaxID=864142 RepID=A0A1A9AN21_PLAOA|nr:PIR Superfamily Protein [Plasmodium ovale wallikeri]
MVQKDQDLAKLPSFRFYAKLDEGYEDLWDYDNFFDTIIKVRLSSNQNISNIQNSLLKAFIYVSNMRISSDQYVERWDYLFYWMGHKVYEIVQKVSDFADIMDITNRLKIHVHPTNEEYDKDLFKIDKDELTKLKKFYDFSQNYDVIEMTTSPSDYHCSHEYNNYIGESHKLYENIKRECLVETTRPYCNLFRNIENKNPKIKNSWLRCHHVKAAIRTDEENPPVHQDLEDETPPVHHDLEDETPPVHHDLEDETPLFPNSGNPTAIIFPVLGLFIIFFLSYKFTPLGTLIHRHLVRKKVNPWEADTETVHESLSDKYETDDNYSEINTHNIRYNPIGNI